MNMNEMMQSMMAQMQEAMMQSMMQAMMQSMQAQLQPQVAQAEPEAPKAKHGMTREEFFALDDGKPQTKSANLDELDFEPVNATTLRYNGYVPSDIWTVNHLKITREWNGKWSARSKGYKFQTHADAVAFAQGYQIVKKLTAEDRQNVKAYKAERDRARAEYYAKRANGDK